MSHLSAFREALAVAGYDAAIVSDKLNQRYLSGFDFDDGLILVTSEKSYLLTDFRYAEAAKEVSREFTVQVSAPGEELSHCMGGLLSEHGAKKVATEDETLSCAEFKRYGEILKDFTLSGGASEILKGLRLCKDEEELKNIEQAQAITDNAFAHILKWIKPEMTEIEVALELEFFMRMNGSDGIAFDVIAVSGTNSSRPHGVPRRCKLEKGFLTMDFGARVNGYCADMTRTVVLGSADEEIKKIYRTVLAAQKAALDAAAEGISCHYLDSVARDLINKAGYEGCFGHSLGHGVGLLIHEDPRLSAKAKPEDVLKRGNVVTFEPGIYVEGKYGCRIEDLACIRPDGSFYNFTKSPKDLIELF